MAKDSFVEALTIFLEDRTGSIDFHKVSKDYKKIDEQTDKLYKQIDTLLGEQGQKLLLNLDTAQNDRMTKAAEISYQKGFMEGIKLIIYSLITG